MITTAAAVAAILLGPLLPGDGRVRWVTASVAVAFLIGRRPLRVRHAPRDAEVVAEGDSIRIVKAGVLSQRIRASEVIAASTARTRRGVALAIVRRHSAERPLLLEFGATEDLGRVRRALRIGHRGFGVVAWSTAPMGRIAAAMLGALWLAIALCAAVGLQDLGLWLALPAVLVSGLALLFFAILGIAPGPRVALTEGFVVIVERAGETAHLPYADVLHVDVDGAGLLIRTRAGLVVAAMQGSLAEEREHVAAQIVSAAQRARGEGPPVPGVPSSLAALAPRAESARAWLERVDAAAASFASPEGAYRGTKIDPGDLWEALENPDVAAPVRAAAARVLARVAPEEARTRVTRVLATDRDSRARACIRIALEESVETAAEELERLV